MRRLDLMLCIPLLVIPTAGCGLLDSGAEFALDLPVQEFEFSLDANILKAQLQAHLDAEGIPLDISNMSELPAQVAGVPLNLQETFELELPPEQVDLSDEEKLKQYIEAGKVKSVTIRYVRADLATNSLNFDTPEIEMYMDELNVTGITASSSKIAIIPVIPAGTTGVMDLEFAPGGRDKMSQYLLGYKFALMAKLALTIDTSVTRTIPGGILAGKLQIALRFTVDPL